MRTISCEFWQFNCWTFQVSFVVCTDSFVDSTGASDSVLDLVCGGLVCHIYWALGSQRASGEWFGSTFFACVCRFT